MVKTQAHSDLKHPHRDDASPSPKRQRANSTSDTASSKKIIDLDDDCLEKIFGYLDFHSVLSVAVANEYLRPAANYVYKRKFKDKIINIHEIAKHHSWVAGHVKHGITVCFEKVNLFDLKACLQFIRCLGPSLTNLHIYYKHSCLQIYTHVHRYINQYCAESLEELELVEKPRLSVDHFDKPFVNVRTVAVHHCHFGEQFPFFSQWFPNLRTLKMFNLLSDYSPWTELPFHRLEYVRIAINNSGRNGFKKNDVAQVLRSSHQLKCLEIHMPDGRQGMTLTTLLNIIEDKPDIQSLTLKMDKYCTDAKPSELQRLVNEHPSLILLDLNHYKFSAENVLFVVRQLNSLQRFSFQLDAPNVQSTMQQFVPQLGGKWQPIMQRDWYRNRPYFELIQL